MVDTVAALAFVPDRGLIGRLVEAAIRAPSADNQHHVRFAVDDGGIVMRAEASFLQCAVPHRRLLILISFGAVVENLRLALTEHGHGFEPHWFPDATDPSVVLDLRWAGLRRVERADPLARHIAGRHTNRRFYRGPALSTAQAATMELAAGGVPGVRLEWCDSRARRGALLRMMRMAETARFARRPLHQELFESIAFDAGWKSSTGDRLAPGSLEVERGLRLPFAALRHWRLMRVANWFGAHRAFGLRAGDLPARSAPHLGVLASTLPADEAALAIGAAFQRLWLAAESLGLALQPMVASAILAAVDDPVNGLDSRTRALLNEGWRTLVGDAMPLVVFRLGHAPPPLIRSGRKPVDVYLSSSEGTGSTR